MNKNQIAIVMVLAVLSLFTVLCVSLDRYHVNYTVYTAQEDGTYFEHQRSVTVYGMYTPNEVDLAWDDADENSKLTVDSVSVDSFWRNNEQLELEE